jgi:hypothetical protein
MEASKSGIKDVLSAIDILPKDAETWNKIKKSLVWKPEFDNTMKEVLDKNIGIWVKENNKHPTQAELGTIYFETWLSCIRLYELCL